jgi:branched-chain amino acid transport system ATP-binding protein
MMLQVADLRVAYGSITAIDGISLNIGKGEIVSIIGSNGAGKSTLLRAIAGILRPLSGTILLDNKEITKEQPDRIVRLGASLVPEGRHVFPDMTVKENLELGAHSLKGKLLRNNLYEMVLAVFPRLKERLGQNAGTLSGGEQQMLAVGRALMSNPRLLLLDEPSMGLSPLITKEIFSLIKKINEEKRISIVLVEQNAHMALDYSQRAYVIETGKIVMEGKAADIKRDPAIIEAYLGFELYEESLLE